MSHNEYPEGKIHKLCVQDYNKTYYEVGVYNNKINATIIEIIFDENTYIESGKEIYRIIVEDANTKGKYLGHKVKNIPCIENYAKPDKDGTMHNIG